MVVCPYCVDSDQRRREVASYLAIYVCRGKKKCYCTGFDHQACILCAHHPSMYLHQAPSIDWMDVQMLTIRGYRGREENFHEMFHHES